MGTENFEEIVKNYQQRVYRVVFSLVRNEPETDEIVQQTFVSAFGGIKKFRGDSSVQTWLIKIALNNVRSYFRKRKFLSFFYDTGGKTEDIKDEAQNTEKSAAHAALKKIIDKEISLLPYRQKEVFTMKHLNGLTINQISEVLGIAQGSVKANIFKAIKNLQKRLEDYGEM